MTKLANARTLRMKMMTMTIGDIGLRMTKDGRWRVESDMAIDVSTSLTSALSYLGMGLSVFPLTPRQKKPPKHFRWEQWQHELPTEDQVKKWFDRSDNNLAVVTGKVSRLLALDVDGDAARLYAENVIQSKVKYDTKEAINKTLWTETGGGGYHVLIRYNPEEFDKDYPAATEIKNTVLWRGGDSHIEVRLKSDGAYVVFPPSMHSSGNVYKFVRGNEIALLSKEQLLDLVRAFKQLSPSPARIRDSIDEPASNAMLVPNRELDEERVMDAVVILKPYYLRGQRHDFVLYLSGWFRKEGITIESARKVIEGLAAEDDEELHDRLATLEDTYNKKNLNEVRGYHGILQILEAQLGSADLAQQILKEIQDVFPENSLLHDNTAVGESDAYDDARGGNKLPSASELAIGLVYKRAILYFKDEYGTPHIKVKVGDHTEIMPVASSRFELYVSKVFYDEMDKQVLKAESLSEVVRILTARTVFDGITAKLHLRTAWGISDNDNNSVDHNTLYYDPTTENWSCIKVTTECWEILPRHPDNVLFTRFKQLPQLMPVRDYQPDVMDRYLDLMHIRGHAARLLVKVMLIASFIPDIGHPITVPNGEQGGVKSTYCRYHKRIVDPCAVELLTIPKDRNEFVQHMHHNYVVVYDNVRIVPKWFSDEICKAVTGSGNSKRKLYTDDEDVAYNYKRCILVNGINNVLTEPDALDRSIMLDFTRISDEKRREEAEVDAEFEAMKPGLLGYILDILVKALSIKPTIKLGRKPRMADFAVWGEAIARAMGCKDLELLEAYYSVLERQNVDAVEATLVGPAIVNFVGTWPQGTAEWEGSPEALLDALRKVAEAFRIDTRDSMWPKKGNSLTRKLKPLLPDLRQGYDIDITVTRDNTGKTKSRNSTWIVIRKISPQSPLSPFACSRNTDNGNEGGDTPPPSKLVSPPQEVANSAQKSDSGGSGDGGHTLRLPLDDGNTGIVRVDGRDYVAFDLEWTNNEDNTGNRTIYAAAFVDNRGNQKVLHILDFAGSEPALLQAITDEILKYPASMGWYTTGIGRGSGDSIEGRGVSAAA
jgi:hypothetical protein